MEVSSDRETLNNQTVLGRAVNPGDSMVTAARTVCAICYQSLSQFDEYFP